ncbi:HpcH/HpaI aldolase/citrate lyase family protein [Leifsonia sp. 2MCAF36]|uniref:HpcH/HpaI aldolase/citrate lyase family protein n=1 Tax=Leifsonia sp. 2MCAF36 TaxID=3232988 RepID=UPI003F951378
MIDVAPAGHTTEQEVDARHARSWQLVSALRLDDADDSTADAVVLDLEDAVPAAGKPAARRAALSFLEDRPTWVRVNDVTSGHWEDDLTAIGSSPGLRGIMLAKVESAEQVSRTAEKLPAGVRIVALIESALGLEAASDIAREPATFRLAFGSGDFRRDTGMADDPVALAYPRSRLVVASAAAGLPGPIDGPTLTDSADVLLAAARTSRLLGMTGKLVLRAAHAERVNEALSPSPAELAWARDTVGRAGDGGAIDGSYLPTLARARALLALADEFGDG